MDTCGWRRGCCDGGGGDAHLEQAASILHIVGGHNLQARHAAVPSGEALGVLGGCVWFRRELLGEGRARGVWDSPTAAAGPFGPRKVMLAFMVPPDMYRALAAELTMWSMACTPARLRTG